MAQKISPKVQEGIGRSIPPAKVTRLSNKDCIPMVLQAEQHLETAFDIISSLKLGDESLKVLGQFQVRVAAFLTGTNKAFEEKEWDDLTQIASVGS